MSTKISNKIETWVNQDTGEVRQVVPTEIKAVDKGFDKVWLGMILAVLGLFGNKRIDVVRYIIENRSRTENTITVSQKKISEDTGVSIQTVNQTIKQLENADFLHRIVPGHYRINPAVIWRGSHMGRMAIMAKFSEEKASGTPKEAEPKAPPTPTALKAPAPQKPRFCHCMTSEGLRCGRLMQEIVEPDGTRWYWCDMCRSGYEDPGSGCEYSQPSKPTT